MSWPNANAMLKAHIVKKRREITVNVSLELDKGRSLGLFGASGAGKSTVLACIAGIEEPDDGYVKLGRPPILSAVSSFAQEAHWVSHAGARPLSSSARERER